MCYSLSQRRYYSGLWIAADRTGAVGAAKTSSYGVEDDNADGTLLVDLFSRLRFARDLRLGEIRRLLRSSVLGSLRLVERPEVTDHDLVQLEQQVRKAPSAV